VNEKEKKAIVFEGQEINVDGGSTFVCDTFETELDEFGNKASKHFPNLMFSNFTKEHPICKNASKPPQIGSPRYQSLFGLASGKDEIIDLRNILLASEAVKIESIGMAQEAKKKVAVELRKENAVKEIARNMDELFKR
jgi:hypothetical protein